MTDRDVLDPAALAAMLQMVGGDTAFLVEMIDEYLQDTPEQLVAMQQALVAGEVAELRRVAHTVKSNSASFGARRLEALCSMLEQQGKQGVLADAAELLEQVVVEYARVKAALVAARAQE